MLSCPPLPQHCGWSRTSCLQSSPRRASPILPIQLTGLLPSESHTPGHAQTFWNVLEPTGGFLCLVFPTPTPPPEADALLSDRRLLAGLGCLGSLSWGVNNEEACALLFLHLFRGAWGVLLCLALPRPTATLSPEASAQEPAQLHSHGVLGPPGCSQRTNSDLFDRGPAYLNGCDIDLCRKPPGSRERPWDQQRGHWRFCAGLSAWTGPGSSLGRTS